MSFSPATAYAKTRDGLHIAYQVVGDGPMDLVFIPWWWSHVEAQWDDPSIAAFLERLAAFSRLIIFDQRGTGMSDPVPLDRLPRLEEWTDDVEAVLDAAGSERAAVVGHGDGGLVATFFAVSRPERTRALVLIDAYARLAADEGYEGVEQETLDNMMRAFEDVWGTGEIIGLIAPSRWTDSAFRDRLARIERLSVSPGAAAAIQVMIGHLDTRALLPSVAAPSLVIHHAKNGFMWVGFGRYLAEHIPNARYVELPGADHLYWAGDTEPTLTEVEQFLTGAPAASRVDRVLATVLFTDIVASTDRLAAVGDRRWRETLDLHDRIVRQQLDRYRGREVKSTGDGFLATFDGPARAIACAHAIIDGLRRQGVDVRAGLHTGEIDQRGSDIGGLAVHIAARVMEHAAGGETWVSSTVRDLVAGSGIAFSDRGEYELKGVPGEWRLFAVSS